MRMLNDEQAEKASNVGEDLPAARSVAEIKRDPMVLVNAEVPVLDTAIFEHMSRLAVVMADAKLVPKHFWGHPADCMLVIQQAVRWHMDPFTVCQKTYVISGTLGYEAQLIAAVVNSRAPIKGRLEIEFEGEGDDLVCIVSATMTGEKKPRIKKSPRIKNILTQNSPLWKIDPQQQLAYWTQRAWARLYCPDVILGVYSSDELADAAAHRGPEHAKVILNAPEPRPTREGQINEAEKQGRRARAKRIRAEAAAAATEPDALDEADRVANPDGISDDGELDEAIDKQMDEAAATLDRDFENKMGPVPEKAADVAPTEPDEFDEETGEVKDELDDAEPQPDDLAYPLPLGPDTTAAQWREFRSWMVKGIGAAVRADVFDALLRYNKDGIALLTKTYPDAGEKLQALIEEHRVAFAS